MVKRHASTFELLRALMLLPFVCGIVFSTACAQQPPPVSVSSAPADLSSWETLPLKENGINFKLPPNWRRGSDSMSQKEIFFHYSLVLNSPTKETIEISITIDTYPKGFVSIGGNVFSKKEALEEDFHYVIQSAKTDSSISEVKKLTLSGVEGVFRVFHIDFKDKDLGVQNGLAWQGYRIYQSKAQELDITISSNPQREDLLRTIFNTLEIDQDKDEPQSSAATSAPAAQSAAANIKLNAEDVGTTADTSLLVRRFTEIVDQRRTTFSNGTVFIRAENIARFSEVLRVVEALNKSHGLPYLAVEVDSARAGNVSGDPVIIGSSVDTGDVYSNTFPRSKMLVVTVGNLGTARGELISGGIDLLPNPFTMRFAARHDIPKEFVVVEVFRDNEYVIGDKPIPSSALRSELEDRLSKTAAKRVMILTRSDSEIRWATFMEVANAAREAGAGMIQLLTLTP